MFKGFHPRRRTRLRARRVRPAPTPRGARVAEAARVARIARIRARLRPPRLLACAALAAAALASAAPAAYALTVPVALAAPAYGRMPDGGPPPSDEPRPDRPDHAYGDLAGTVPGVGRDRPGRPVSDPVNRDAMVASRPLAVRPRTRPAAPPKPRPTPSPGATTALGTAPNERAADLAAHLLPLGTGCALMGVGLGYLGARLRRGI